jgi:hypothetical protein
MAKLDDLDLGDHPIDDRWTESKLIAAGYRYSGEGACRKGCGAEVAFYVKETLKGKRWLVLDEGSLSVHECDR